MSETILVTIKGGKATVTAKGFKGASCLDATLAVERALGQKSADHHTSEMREQTGGQSVQVGTS